MSADQEVDYRLLIQEAQEQARDAARRGAEAFTALSRVRKQLDAQRSEHSRIENEIAAVSKDEDDYNDRISDLEQQRDAIETRIGDLEAKEAEHQSSRDSANSDKSTADARAEQLSSAYLSLATGAHHDAKTAEAVALRDQFQAEGDAATERANLAQKGSVASGKFRDSVKPAKNKGITAFVEKELAHFDPLVQGIVRHAHAMSEAEIHGGDVTEHGISNDALVSSEKIVALAEQHVEDGIIIARETAKSAKILRQIYTKNGSLLEYAKSMTGSAQGPIGDKDVLNDGDTAVSISADRQARNALIGAEIALMSVFSYGLMSDSNPFFKGDDGVSQTAKAVTDALLTVTFASGRALGVMYASAQAETRENRGESGVGWRATAITALILNAAVAAWEANDHLNESDLENARAKMAEINKEIEARQDELIRERERISERISQDQARIAELSRPEAPPELAQLTADRDAISRQLGVLRSMYDQGNGADFGGQYTTRARPDGDLTADMRAVLRELGLPEGTYPTEAVVDGKIAQLTARLSSIGPQIERISAQLVSSGVPEANRTAVDALRTSVQQDIERMGQLTETDATLAELRRGLEDAQRVAADARPGEGWAKYFPNPVNAGLGVAAGGTIALLSYVAGGFHANTLRKRYALAGYEKAPADQRETGLGRVFGVLSTREESAESKLIHQQAAEEIVSIVDDPKQRGGFVHKNVMATVDDIEGDMMTALGLARDKGLITPHAYNTMSSQVASATDSALDEIRGKSANDYMVDVSNDQSGGPN